jgi:DNA-binding NtrC family response regulator
VANVTVVADDLIWMSRLVAAVERAGAQPRRAAGRAQLKLSLADPANRPAAVLLDLNGRSYDGLELVELAAAAGTPVIVVGQHEDVELRKRALDAGASRFYSYNRMHREGARLLAAALTPGGQRAR